MPEQELDAPQVDPRFESVRSEGMPEYVRVAALKLSQPGNAEPSACVAE